MERYVLKLRTFISMGNELAKLSVCKRKQVAAIVFPVDCSRVYAIGYNGPPHGEPNDACTNVEGDCGCVHAEANAIAKFNSEAAKLSILYTTCRPCVHCAGLILNCDKIAGLIWGEEYRKPRGIYRIIRSGRILVRSVEEVLSPTRTRCTDDILTHWRSLQ